MKNRALKLNRLLLLPALLFALAVPCRAMTQPTACPVASIEELLQRYHSEDAPDSTRVYFSEQPLVLTGRLTLDATQGAVELAATAGIRVSAGAELTLDNPNLLVMGPPPVITVERGGTLRILRWNPMMTDGTMPTDGMIRIEDGGTISLGNGITTLLGMVVKEHNSSDEISPPPEPDTTPEPEPPPDLVPMEAVFDPVLYLTSAAGRVHVEAVLPSAVTVRLAWVDGEPAPASPELAVRWDLSGLNCEAPGTYTVYGDFIPEGLTAKGVSNPLSLRPVAELTILESAPIHDLSWQTVGSNGTPKLRLSFTLVPEGVEALYLLRSEDGVNWRRCVGSYGENFLPAVTTHENTSFLVYRWPVSDDVFYLRLEVAGSAAQGPSNIIRVPPLSSGGALSSGGPKGDAEDGSSEGNQGGGGQGQSERTGQQKPEATPEATPPPTAVPPQRAQTESGVAETEPQSDMAGASGPQQPAGGGHTTAPIFYSADSTTAAPSVASPGSQLPSEQAFAERLTAPDNDTGGGLTDEDISAIGADTDTTVAEGADTTVAEELSAARQEPDAVLQADGDQGGLAALVTLSLCGGVAATGAVSSYRKSNRRRP